MSKDGGYFPLGSVIFGTVIKLASIIYRYLNTTVSASVIKSNFITVQTGIKWNQFTIV